MTEQELAAEAAKLQENIIEIYRYAAEIMALEPADMIGAFAIAIGCAIAHSYGGKGHPVLYIQKSVERVQEIVFLSAAKELDHALHDRARNP